MAHEYFNVSTKKEWTDIIVPSLRILITNEAGYMGIIEQGNVVRFNIIEGIMVILIGEEEQEILFSDFYLIDDSDTLQFQKTMHLRALYTEIFEEPEYNKPLYIGRVESTSSV